MQDVKSILGPMLTKIGAIACRPGESKEQALLRSGFQAEWVWNHAKALGANPTDANKIMRLGAWMFATGVRNHDALVVLMAEYAKRRPRNAYAYFAPGSAAREGIVERFHGDRAAAEGQRFKAQDEGLFGAGPR